MWRTKIFFLRLDKLMQGIKGFSSTACTVDSQSAFHIYQTALFIRKVSVIKDYLNYNGLQSFSLTDGKK